MLNFRLFKKKTFPCSKKTELWTSESEFDTAWKKRIELMVSYIDIPGKVADFGCGMMWLEQFLKKENSYLPIDYIKRDHRTIVVDLNSCPLPVFEAEIAFLSGVLEYVLDINEFFEEIAQSNFQKIILSYCTLEKHSNIEKRLALNWVSHESIFTLLSIFLTRYDLSAISDINDNTILVFDRKRR